MQQKTKSNTIVTLATLFILSFSVMGCSTSPVTSNPLPSKTFYRSTQVLGKKIFYREAGDPKAPTLILLHGYPSSSHTYRELIPLLSTKYHIIAPDNLGSGYSEHPDPKLYTYTFDRLADHIEGLLTNLEIKRYALYMQDFGAPVGFRLMMKHPERIVGIISQNANAYLDGLTEKRRDFFRTAHDDRSNKHVSMLYKWTSDDAIINGQYLRDVPPDRRNEVSPDAWTHDLSFLRSESDRMIQVQLFQDYQTNIDRYPHWQELMRKWQFPALIVWGKNDAAFIPDGAKAFLKDLPKAQLHLLDAGHFAVEENATEVARHVLGFMYSLSYE
jgi:pimeloyl-ACP methyl ester carboxylesterase